MSSPYEIAYGMVELELSQGGHGNGIFLTDGERLIKGLTKSVAELARIVQKEKKLTIFHTRLASCGGKSDELCHPHRVDGDQGEFIVCQNGHWTQWGRFSTYKEKSDTQTMARLIAEHGIGFLLGKQSVGSGVWIIYEKKTKRTYLIKRNGQFLLQKLQPGKSEPNPFFHASEELWCFAGHRQAKGKLHDDKVYEFEQNGNVTTWKGIEAVDVEPAKTYVSGVGSYGAYGSDWDEYDLMSTTGTFNKWRHDFAFGFDGGYWGCLCPKGSPKILCEKCEKHDEVWGLLPFYDFEIAYLHRGRMKWNKDLAEQYVDFYLQAAQDKEDKEWEKAHVQSKEDADLETAIETCLFSDECGKPARERGLYCDEHWAIMWPHKAANDVAEPTPASGNGKATARGGASTNGTKAGGKNSKGKGTGSGKGGSAPGEGAATVEAVANGASRPTKHKPRGKRSATKSTDGPVPDASPAVEPPDEAVGPSTTRPLSLPPAKQAVN